MSNENKTIIVKGSVNSARYGTANNSDVEKYRIALKCSNIDELREVAKEVYKNAQLKPNYLTDNTVDNVNLCSLYDMPLKLSNDKVSEEFGYDKLSEFIEDGYVIDAEIRVKCVLKDGAIYPSAVMVDKMGSKYDPFANFN